MSQRFPHSLPQVIKLGAFAAVQDVACRQQVLGEVKLPLSRIRKKLIGENSAILPLCNQ